MSSLNKVLQECIPYLTLLDRLDVEVVPFLRAIAVRE